ncbi:hypothetical protein S7711_00536 [Stachybotrys chartarum IBT 7711]|uniref:Elongator complex protein 6 n=1 Tax=Stachybotrys chartarum (strain CBS 109288 / IBT 7711) TaxID=1280523 RepID=A0A084ATM9_STACB|nr:hypothetical protein S7711_00536 [Stachybotrys chartarum IBT 7711]
MSSKIPPLLEPYLALPAEASLLLLTNVLGASSNWLVLRYLCSYLKGPVGNRHVEDENGDRAQDVGVMLVSFLRDGTFWHEGAGKLGLDLDALNRAGRFVFVDGLTQLFNGDQNSGGPPKQRVLGSSSIDHLAKYCTAALADLKTTKKIIIVDQLDLLLAASGEDVTSTQMQNLVLVLREHAHAALLTLAADTPLLHGQTTTLERQHAALVLGLAHEADAVLALRMLDTGSARDVSGVVRITGAEGTGEGKEYLYYVAGDGGVKVFERGA